MLMVFFYQEIVFATRQPRGFPLFVSSFTQGFSFSGI